MSARKIKIGFIGGGNMGEALIAALLRKRLFRPNQIGVSEPDPARLKRLRRRFRIVPFRSNPDLARASQTLLLAVKPQQMAPVLEEIRNHLTRGHLLLSVAAGLDTSFFFKRIPPKTRLIRIMPNLGLTIGEGAAALYAAPTASRRDQALSLRIFSAAGKAVTIGREEMMDTVTVVSGSGPALVALFMESLIEAGEKLGLAGDVGKRLVLQTVIGTAKMVETLKGPIAQLIEKVASKGGTTEAALKVLTSLSFRETIREAVAAGVQRAKELRQDG